MPQGRGLRLPLVSGRLSCYAEGSPFGASFFPSDGKETKGSPVETHITVGNRFPPAPVRSPPDPRNLRGAQFQGAAGHCQAREG